MGIASSTQHPVDIDLSQYPIAIVRATFNAEVTDLLELNAQRRYRELTGSAIDLSCYQVPGCCEIPQMIHHLCTLKQYRAYIALGAVVRGETGHYDVVCQMVSQGCMQTALTHNVPLAFGVLTTDTQAQAMQRAEHSGANYGGYCVDVVHQLLTLQR